DVLLGLLTNSRRLKLGWLPGLPAIEADLQVVADPLETQVAVCRGRPRERHARGGGVQEALRGVQQRERRRWLDGHRVPMPGIRAASPAASAALLRVIGVLGKLHDPPAPT